jgi:NAD(P)-dependent dehydrogenase (short-subunit alcohol dehydrogenase family)
MSKVAVDLKGKVALITGASRGIGRRTARLFVEAGAQVAVNYRTSQQEAEELVASFPEDAAVAIQADLGNPADVERLVDQTIEQFGRLDILVNNAATFAANPFDGEDYAAWNEGWRQTLDVNLIGAANAAFLAMRQMRRQGSGKIINVASRAAFRGETEFGDYGASKAALVNLTRSLARACAKDGIVATCVAPGFIETEMAASELEKNREEIEAQIPLGRVGSVDDVAYAILYLASNWADYLAGVTIDINGGSYFH